MTQFVSPIFAASSPYRLLPISLDGAAGAGASSGLGPAGGTGSGAGAVIAAMSTNPFTSSVAWAGRHVRLLLSVCFLAVICFLFTASYTTPLSFGVEQSRALSLLASDVHSAGGGSEHLAPKCRRKNHVFFMKTHKCASSSLQNIFFRYADRHNLTIVLPPGKTNYFGHPAFFNCNMLPPESDIPHAPIVYSIFAAHTRFHVKEARRLMPDDTVFVTILRDPVSVFSSMYSYYDFNVTYKLSLASLARQHVDPRDPVYNVRRHGKFGLNQMAFDLGLAAGASARGAKSPIVDSFVRRLADTFQLVLIADRMAESLVLLRHLLCWSVDEVVVFKKNARSTSFKRAEDKLTGRELSVLRRLNAIDQRIYDFFDAVLTEKVEQFGRGRMNEEVAALEERTKFWFDECVKDVKKVDSLETAKKKSIYSNKVLYFEEKVGADPECHRLLREELAYTRVLREKQWYINYNGSRTKTAR